MADFVVRNFKKEYLEKLDRLAKEKKLSREEYVRRVLQIHVMRSEVEETENKYTQLVELVCDLTEANCQRMDQMMEILNEIKKRLQGGRE